MGAVLVRFLFWLAMGLTVTAGVLIALGFLDRALFGD
jgi:uncharacterized membrane protein YphA (DoxX/SURF4 family)